MSVHKGRDVTGFVADLEAVPRETERDLIGTHVSQIPAAALDPISPEQRKELVRLLVDLLDAGTVEPTP